jgi:hypothetical protein
MPPIKRPNTIHHVVTMSARRASAIELPIPGFARGFTQKESPKGLGPKDLTQKGLAQNRSLRSWGTADFLSI